MPPDRSPAAARPPVPVNDDQDLARQLASYRQQLDEVAAENLRKDYEISGLRKEIRQHVRAFALLSELQHSVTAHHDVGEILQLVMTGITASLGMDRAVVFRPIDGAHEYQPWFWTGFPDGCTDEFERSMASFKVEVPELQARGSALLVNPQATRTATITTLQKALKTPFFVCLPVFVDNRPIALILGGRVKETAAVFAPISESDVETFRAIAGLISAVMQNMRRAVLAETNRLKTDFFANISHEFRTPITLSLGPIGGLLSQRYGQIPDAASEQLRVIESSQRRLLRLVDELLDVAGSEPKSMALRCARAPAFNALVAQRVTHFQGLAEERSITLEYRPVADVDAAAIYVDVEKFDRVLVKLLSNAHKFTPAGGRVGVSTRLDGDHVLVEVVDSGVGIPPDQLPHVFDRSRQADSSRSREFSGTAIGLASVKALMQLHHGSVTATSAVGQGSTFQLRWPTGRDHLEAEQIVGWVGADADTVALRESATYMIANYQIDDGDDVAAINAGTRTHHDDARPTVVFADDNRELRAYVGDLLAQDYNVYFAADGEDGLCVAAEVAPDLILSDLVMPNMNGAEFCRAVREDPRLESTPFILLTAKAGVEDRVLGLEEGADDYLGKPFSERELKARLGNMIRLRRQELRLAGEVDAAHEIQRALLPRWPRRAGPIEIDALYRPCTELSGDFFDVLEGGDDALWVYLAAVSSHGAAAARVTLLVKSLVREVVAHDLPKTVPGLLAALQRDYDKLGLDCDVGIQVARVDLAAGAVEVAGGNAPVALHRAAGGKVTPVVVESGSSLTRRRTGRNREYRSTVVMLERGDSLHLFTDGCVEFFAQGRRFGTKRLARALGALPHGSAWAEALEQLLQGQLDRDDFDDDLTMLRVSRAV